MRFVLSRFPGPDGSDQDAEELRIGLRQAEEQVGDLTERLENTTSNVEQYRAMVLSLEESLSKEKQVYTSSSALLINEILALMPHYSF